MFETPVTLVGNVLSSPKTRETPQGTKVVSFRMGSTARRFDRSAGQWVDGDRVYATVQCRRRLADGVSRSVFNHDPVVVTGRLRTREYEHDGQLRSVNEIDATGVGLDLARTARGRPDGDSAAAGELDAGRGGGSRAVERAVPG